MRRDQVGQNGWRRDWQAAVRARLRGVQVDAQGHLAWAAGGGRLSLQEAQRRGIALEALVRARAALGDEVAVVDEALGKNAFQSSQRYFA